MDAVLKEKKDNKREALQFVQSLFLNSPLLAHSDLSRLIARMIISPEAVAFIFKRLPFVLPRIHDTHSKPVALRDTPFFAMVEADSEGRKSIGIRSLESGECVQKINHSQGKQHPKIKVDRSGAIIGTMGEDRYAKVWDLQQGTCLQVLEEDDIIKAVTFAPRVDSSFFVITVTDKRVRVWKNGFLVYTFCEPGETVKFAKVNKAGDVLFIAFLNCGRARVYCLDTGTCLRELNTEASFLHTAKFSSTLPVIVTASSNRDLQVWSLDTGECLFKRSFMFHMEISLTFNSSGDKVLVSHDKGKGDHYCVTLVSIALGSITHARLLDEEKDAWVAVFNPIGDKIATASKYKGVKIWDAHTLECIKELPACGHFLSFNANGDKLLTGCTCKDEIKVWLLESGLCIHRINSIGVRKSFFIGTGNTLAITWFGAAAIITIGDFNSFIDQLTLEQAFLINAIYEIVLLQRIAMLRACAQKCRSLAQDEDLAWLAKSATQWFDSKIKKIKYAAEDLVTKTKARPGPLKDEDGKIVNRDDLVFDFTDKPEALLKAYCTFSEPMKQVLGSYIKLP